MNKKALILGISGQDGAYLAHYLLSKGYEVVGTSRDSSSVDLHRVTRLGINKDVDIRSLALHDFRSVLNLVTSTSPDEIYNLAGQTSVSLSFEQPVESMESISLVTLNILEVIRYLDRGIRFFNAGSSECYGNTGPHTATEEFQFCPRSPYAVAKAAAYWQVKTYREAYNVYACTGILANHESPLRHNRFVTQKVVNGVREIKLGNTRHIKLGNLFISRDWGWAPEYVQAMHLMLEPEKPSDYIIASGKSSSLSQFVEHVIRASGLPPGNYVNTSEELKRPADIDTSSVNPARINKELKWKANTSLTEIAEKMYHDVLF